MRRLLLALTGMLMAGAAAAQPPFVHDPDRRFDQYTWLTSHNAYNTGLNPVPNQSLTIRQQLDMGVRGLMIDLVESSGQVKLCHKICLVGETTLVAELQGSILPFLRANPHEIVTLHLEDFTSRGALAGALAQVPELAELTFKPDTWATSQWPSIRQMVDSGQRLLVFTLNNANSGDFAVGQGTAHFMRSDQGTVENYWSLGVTVFSHDYSCYSRWPGIPLSTKNVDWPGKAWSRLFTMNQFHGASAVLHSRLDNRFDKLQDRVDDYCGPAAGRLPNYIAVDHVESGDGPGYAGVLNQGGIVLYKGNGGTREVVCGVPGLTAQSIGFKDGYNLGCENDDARSAVLFNVKKGMRFYVYDSPNGSTKDDWAMVEVLRDHPGPVVVGSFERQRLDADIRIEAHYRNGLDGKVSRLVVVPPPR